MTDLETLQRAISAAAFADEQEVVRGLTARLSSMQALEPEIRTHAEALIAEMRKSGAGNGIEAFLSEYGLDTQEGVAVMCLAEALLRIPDAETANRLIRSTFSDTEWKRHLGESDSFFVNASSWGLLFTGTLVKMRKGEGPARMLSRLAGKFGEPVIREALKKAMRFIGGQFVMGETIEDALKRARGPECEGYRFSYDMLGEGARSDAQAQAYVNSYLHAIERIGQAAKGKDLLAAPGISVKLSALHPRYQLSQESRVMEVLLPRLGEIVRAAKEAGITVAIDAEEATRLDIEMKIFAALFAEKEFADWQGLGFVVQAYQKRALPLIGFLMELSRKQKRLMPVRLVKGAYWDSEIKLAQTQGFTGYPVFTRKEHTDVSYIACADALLSSTDCFYPQFATHNARTVATLLALARAHGASAESYELQRLHGMGEKLHALTHKEIPTRIYAPVGRHKDLLAYLIRRLLENGANTSFVHLLMDRARPPEELAADPLSVTAAHGGAPNPHIPLPARLYGDAWRNSEGLDFGNLAQVETLAEAMKPFLNQTPPSVPDASEAELNAALKSAHNFFPEWSATHVEERAQMLEKAANSIETHKPELMALLAREARKTLADGNAEVREAADFCRYYAHSARALLQETRLPGPTGESNTLSLHPRGVFACISPWNFPLAIFTGQVAAALAAGNCAIAKPAEQTPKIAARAVELLHAAGIPKEALHLLPGKGETLGAALVADQRIDGVVFTGSSDTAKRIAQALAARKGALVPLIAETGGQNCMVVDSSALLEQAVDDIVTSAFGSAGQRCSALRVLYVQEEVADDLLSLLSGATAELKPGDPAKLSTDIGPVIDAEAAEMLRAHIQKMCRTAKFIAAAPAPEGGNFIAPHAFEIKNIGVLEGEVFGPVLHVIRFAASERERVADEINGTGYGLTFGIHSRISENVEFFLSRVRAGNCYVNRSMIGATVGVQPFGGEGLSGTGPKAGGPHYLLRFLSERTRTVNTAAIGGNAALLSGEESEKTTAATASNH